VSREMMSAFFQHRTISGRLVRNLGKLRAQLDARAPEAPPCDTTTTATA